MPRIYLAGIICLLLPTLSLAQASSYNIQTVAGDGVPGYNGDGGAAISAELNAAEWVTLDSSGNLYIADTANQVVRKVAGGKISTVAGNGTLGYAGDGAVATSANLDSPLGVVVDSAGNLYISDYVNNAIRMVVPGGNITTVVGGAGGNGSAGYSGDGGPAASALLNGPVGLAMDSAGNLYIADSGNNRIRMVAPDGTISTVAGTGSFSVLHVPFGVAVDAAGNLYIADNANNRIRKRATDGTITTVAGTGTAGFSGDGGPATSAQVNSPYDVAVDSSGDLYIADRNNSRIRQVSALGTISTIAGRGGSGYMGDGGAANSADLSFSTAVAVNSTTGNVYIADHGNSVIRMLTPGSPSINSGGVVSAATFGGFTAAAPGSWIEMYGTNLSVAQKTWTTADFNGANAPTSLAGTTVTVGGQPAFIDYVSGGQVDAQLPSGVGTGQQNIVVKTAYGTSSSYTITVNATEPGMLAPSWFKIGGTQYVVAQFLDGTYVLPPGAISGVTSRRAKAGDTIVMYGVGFGPTPPVPAGQIAPTNLVSLGTSFGISFGPAQAAVGFAGLAPGLVGLYQFNVTVPTVTASDTIPVTFTLGGIPGTQTLYTAVQ